jgi:RNA polymerase sigma-70 factor, ECF subfamily
LDEAKVLALLGRVRRGDAIAVHEFYREVEPFLRGLTRRLLDPRLRRQVDSVDVTQSVIRRVLASPMTSRLEGETRILGWLAAIVRNRIRTLSRRTTGPGGAAWQTYEEVAASGSAARDPAAQAADLEEVHRLRAALESLPEAERTAIVLHDFEDLPFEGVAQLLDRPSADAARKLHARALERLRRALGIGTAKQGA